MSGMTRRDHARGAGILAALSIPAFLGANDLVGIGYIGLGNRGDQVHDAFLELGDAQTASVCDLREDYLDLATRKSCPTPTRFKDYRKLLDDKAVDAIVIATPDHWHALMFVAACHAGREVYVEKPLSLTVSEGRKMVEVAGRTGRVEQVGTNRRSWKFTVTPRNSSATAAPGTLLRHDVFTSRTNGPRAGSRNRRPAAHRMGMGTMARSCPQGDGRFDHLRPSQTNSAAESVGQFIEAAETAVKVKTDLILLPEGITVVGTGKSYAEVAEPIPGPTTLRLGELARHR